MYKKAQLTLSLHPGETSSLKKGDVVKKGTVIITSSPLELDEIHVAKLLSIPAKNLEKYTTVKLNQKINVGDVIGQKKSLLKSQTITSPVAGKVTLIDTEKGVVGITKGGRTEEIKAWFSGIVAEASRDKVTFTINGQIVTGLSGRGAPVSGKLVVIAGGVTAFTMPTNIERSILAVKEAFSDLVAKADALGVVAIIAEKMDDPPFTLPHLIISSLDQATRFHNKIVVVNGDAKELLIIEE